MFRELLRDFTPPRRYFHPSCDVRTDSNLLPYVLTRAPLASLEASEKFLRVGIHLK